jgi:hypothetical protein
MNKPQNLGTSAKSKKDARGRWLQTEASAHEAWAMLIMKHKNAAAFMHVLVSQMDRGSNAVVASHGVLANLMNCSVRSIKNYIAVLSADKWIQVLSMGKGSTNAYIVNSMVAWGQKRDNLRYSRFSAQVIVKSDDQNQTSLIGDLRKIPVLFEGNEQQLPAGQSGEPPSQKLLDGFEPDLPTISGHFNDD